MLAKMKSGSYFTFSPLKYYSTKTNYMKITWTLLILCAFVSAQSQTVKLCSWNLFNFGDKKTQKELVYIASTIKKFDVVSLVEIDASQIGPDEVEKLKTTLNAEAKEWDYEVSEPTSSAGKGNERYAVFWKTAKLKRVSPAVLEVEYSDQLDREPYLVGFKNEAGKMFTVAAFHAIPTSKKPQDEIPYLQYIPAEYPQKNIIFCGDFNLSGEHKAFDPLKSKGYAAAFFNQKTSLKQKCPDNTDCLSSVYDNVFYKSSRVTITKAGVIEFYKDFTDFSEAHHLSDHVPVWVEFSLN